MKYFRIAASLTLLGACAVMVTAQPPARPAPVAGHADDVSQIPPIPATPAAVKNILYARQFKLEQGYEFEWRADHPKVTAGWLVVLEVDPDLVYPRNVAEPVLYVGKTT